MLNEQKTYTGTSYTITAALLMLAFVFSPAILYVSRPFNFASVSTALLFSGLCVGLAWLNWRAHSELTIPSIVSRKPRVK
jgi:hypothetical protein